MKKYLTIKEADTLLEKYYDGETNNNEQALLQDFLMQENLPERFTTERALFGYYANEKQQHTPTIAVPNNSWLRLNPMWRWSLAAAIMVGGVFILDNRIQAQNRNVAYIDGIRCTDSKKVTELAIASIHQIDLGVDEVAGTVDKMNDKNSVEIQLQLFHEQK